MLVLYVHFIHIVYVFASKLNETTLAPCTNQLNFILFILFQVEYEAHAYAKIGVVYDVVMKMPCTAKSFYTQAVQLAVASAPRSFNQAGL